MKRYTFLTKDDTYEALMRLRDAFLASKNGDEVEQIINGLLSEDEKIKIGRRIIIAELLEAKIGIDVISKELKVGKNTIAFVTKSLDNFLLALNFYRNDKRKLKQLTNKSRMYL